MADTLHLSGTALSPGGVRGSRSTYTACLSRNGRQAGPEVRIPFIIVPPSALSDQNVAVVSIFLRSSCTADICTLPVIIASRVALIASDVVVLGVTWSVTRTYRSQGILRRFGRATTLAGVLYKNGAYVCLPTCVWDLTYIRQLTCARRCDILCVSMGEPLPPSVPSAAKISLGG